MADRQALLANLDSLHTTELGRERIKRNLHLDGTNPVQFCKDKILDKEAILYKKGKNWYCEVDQMKITIHSSSYTIITAHILK